MKKYLKIFYFALTIVIAALGLYYQVFYKERISLNVETVSTTLLTRPFHIEGLRASYTFHDSINVERLWQTTFVIKNTGNKTILGEGFSNKNIRNSYIPLKFEKCNRLLSTKLTNSNNDAFLINNNLYISQWKPNEFCEIMVISDGLDSPCLTICDRDIVDSEITYSVYSPKTDTSNKKLIDYLPNFIKVTLKWIIVAIIITVSLASIVEVIKQTKKQSGVLVIVLTIIACLIIIAIFASPLLWIF